MPHPRITKLIAQGTRWCPLTVVTGPPGAGKTMALALWAAAEARPVAWVGLDKFDNRPGVFWSYIVAALRQSGVAIPRLLRTTDRGRLGDEGFLLRFARCWRPRTRPAPGGLLTDGSAAAAVPLPAGGRADRDPGQVAILVVEPLTERERQVLQLVSGMLNTAEIASEMYISVNTVKTHLKSIFRKLSAVHRAEAIAEPASFS